MSDTQHFTAVQLKPVLGAELQWSRVVKSLAGVLSSRVQSTVSGARGRTQVEKYTRAEQAAGALGRTGVVVLVESVEKSIVGPWAELLFSTVLVYRATGALGRTGVVAAVVVSVEKSIVELGAELEPQMGVGVGSTQGQQPTSDL